MNNSITEIIGVDNVSLFFQKELGWVFRPISRVDVGIDGDVEIWEGGEATGKHIALQIKSGQSYLKENKKGKFVFYIDNWHYRYWQKYDRPVIILFYDDKKNQIVWERVNRDTIVEANNKRKLIIFPTNVLTKESSSILKELVNIEQGSIISEDTISCEDLSFDYCLFCIREANYSLNDLASSLEKFRVDLTNVGENQNMLLQIINSARIRFESASGIFVTKYMDACRYFKVFRSNSIYNQLEVSKTLLTNIHIIDENIRIFDEINRNIKMLKKTMFPRTIRNAAALFNDQVGNMLYELNNIRVFLYSYKD